MTRKSKCLIPTKSDCPDTCPNYGIIETVCSDVCSDETPPPPSAMKKRGCNPCGERRRRRLCRLKTNERCISERVEWLARPQARHLRTLWEEKCELLTPRKRDNVKKALEEDYFMTPEQTEEYFSALRAAEASNSRRLTCQAEKKERDKRTKEMQQRQKWLVGFSAQIAYRLCEYVSKGDREALVSNRLRSIADVVLERVAEILGEPKPSRQCGTRLARFMIAVSDRIAVWIENSIYRAEEQLGCPCPPQFLEEPLNEEELVPC